MTHRKIFSIPHFENSNNALHDDTYYQMIRNSSQKFKDEVHDIYFAKCFRYLYDGKEKRYANPMGVEATDAQVDGLFRIQEECGIEISLTINSVETPQELFFDDKVVEAFIAFLKSYYDRGLRSCTIASPHIMKSGILHDAFPEMRWKNTVNQRVATAQQVLDHIFCGYDTILLDRSICRNLSELKKIRKAVNYYNKTYQPRKKVLTSLLVMEGCLASCPFKKEHDSMGEHVGARYFQTVSKLTCDNWRHCDPFTSLPRNGVDMIISDREMFNEIVAQTDILKFSGRFTSFKFKPGEIGNRQACWSFFSSMQSQFDKIPVADVYYSDNLTDGINDHVMPLHVWGFTCEDPNKEGKYYKNHLDTLYGNPNFWKTVKGKRLARILKNCRSQCWECHECEKVFGTPPFDSSLQLHGERK